MRTTYGEATVRLYHLDDAAEGGAITTLFYGPMEAALRVAAAEDAAIRAGLYLATDNDVIAWVDLVGDESDGID